MKFKVVSEYKRLLNYEKDAVYGKRQYILLPEHPISVRELLSHEHDGDLRKLLSANVEAIGMNGPDVFLILNKGETSFTFYMPLRSFNKSVLIEVEPLFEDFNSRVDIDKMLGLGIFKK